MSRYTLGEIAANGLHVLLKDGKATKATASPRAVFYNKAEIHGGEFNGGEFNGGWFNGGEFNGGEFNGGWFHGGWFHGGVFHGGVFRGGWFNGGVFHGGVFRGGVFRGGVFRGGEFNGGVFRGGEFNGGWLPLQIQGSRHFLNIPDGQQIRIGCKVGTPAWWRLNYKQVGAEQNYTEAQIAEYHEYIKLATKIINNAKKQEH